MKVDILNRSSGAIQLTAEIDCAENAPTSLKLGLSVKWAIRTGANLTGAYLTCADLTGADLGGANLTYAYLTGAYLTGADLSAANLTCADLTCADLHAADLGGANLGGANLTGADLTCADLTAARLSAAYLSGADLRGANLGNQWIIQGAIRSDGYAFFLQKLAGDKEPMVKAGCRYFTIAEAQAHWEETRAGQSLLIETETIVRCMVAMAKARGLM